MTNSFDQSINSHKWPIRVKLLNPIFELCAQQALYSFMFWALKVWVSITYEIVSLYLLQLAIASRVGIFSQAFHISASMNKNVNVHKDSDLHWIKQNCRNVFNLLNMSKEEMYFNTMSVGTEVQTWYLDWH